MFVPYMNIQATQTGTEAPCRLFETHYVISDLGIPSWESLCGEMLHFWLSNQNVISAGRIDQPIMSNVIGFKTKNVSRYTRICEADLAT
jgi:hypothetical protein